jgi:anaerobic selenocysteine-containing dehydrogenase
MVYGFKEDIVSAIQTGDIVRVDTDKGEVEVVKKVS